MLSRLSIAALAALVALGSARSASAGSAEEEARVVFQEGLDAERSGDTSAACGKFRRALELIHELGPIKKVKECELREGKLVAARDKLKELVAKWPQEDETLVGFRSELKAVEGRIARLDVALDSKTPSTAHARVDTRPIDLPASGLELDPGAHEVVLEVPGAPVVRTPITLAEGERKAVTLALPEAAPPPPPPKPEPRTGIGGLGIAGITLGALGVAGLIGGAITSPLVLSKRDEFEACKDAHTASCSGLADEGRSLLVANGALYIGGGVLAALGGTLLVIDLATMSSASDQKAAHLKLGPASASLELSF